MLTPVSVRVFGSVERRSPMLPQGLSGRFHTISLAARRVDPRGSLFAPERKRPELFQRSGPLQRGVWDKMMRGLSTRNYGAVVKDFQTACGIEKSAVSENYIEASREKVKQLMERPVGELRLCAILMDGTPFKDRQMIVALGIGCDGTKTVLGMREGATETTVVSALLSDLAECGLDFSIPRLYVLDGGKALHAAVRRHAGEAAFIQRCQVHKKRNVVDHLPEEHNADVKKKLQNAYAKVEYPDAKRALEKLHRELMDLNPRAAVAWKKAWRKRSPCISCGCRINCTGR